jgi:hypothetical protein
MLATEGEKNETARSLPVNGPIWSTTLPVNENLHFFCNVSKKWLKSGGFWSTFELAGSPAHDPDCAGSTESL